MQSEDVAPFLEQPESAEMGWSEFAQQYEDRTEQKIVSYQCFHTGTTTSVGKSTIRTTQNGHNHALVMEAHSGEVYIVISKAEGCDEEKLLDPTFIGWVRVYEGALFGERAWYFLDAVVDRFFQDISGEKVDDNTYTSYMESDEEIILNHHRWRQLLMRPRQNDKGEWSYVYTAPVDGKDYTLLNKGARFLQTGLLETWNPPRAKSVRQDEKVDVRWMWYDGNVLHFCDQKNDEYSTVRLHSEVEPVRPRVHL